MPGSSSAEPLVMGVVNVTPDSFSDGGRWFDADAAIEHALQLVAEGADVLDVGGESTRPGAARVDPDEELRRVIPVIRELAGRGLRVSVDTMRASTARAAVEAGAEIINDVSAGLADEAMARIAADSGATYVAMHWRGHSDRMDDLAEYDDVARDVRDELARRVDELVAAGVHADRLILDPGLGFSKRAGQNWELLANLDVLAELGLPILVGASRKRFLGALLPEGAPVEDRDLPTAVISVLSAQAGAWGVRVHDVAGTRVALDVARAWQSGRRGQHS
ncbi:dihydropteroate synthase [Agromyces binzhouensis]|uniref:dihydropteroate synthase n=1 Tax=Agromyces binzhouensis TaxID=1817495 RepID=UPI0036383965